MQSPPMVNLIGMKMEYLIVALRENEWNQSLFCFIFLAISLFFALFLGITMSLL